MQEREHKEEEFFNRWESEIASDDKAIFIKDGMVNPERYEAAKVKITFILKEVNSPTSEKWELSKYVRNGGRASTWNNIARWTAAIIENKMFSEVNNMTAECRKEYLAQISVVNLKKTPGLATSKPKEIKTHAEVNREYLIKQLDIYEPDVVICCGTGQIFVETVLGIKNPEWIKPNGPNGISYLRDTQRNRWIISTYHPQARKRKEFLYNILVPYVKDLLKTV